MNLDDFIDKDDLQHDVEDEAYSFIKAGFVTKLELPELIMLNLEEEIDGYVADSLYAIRAAHAPFVEEPVIKKRVEDLIHLFSDELYDRIVIEQDSWGETTHQKLAVAFKELDAKGIRAEMNFECCQSCGGYAMRTEEKSKNYKGFLFFHGQDMERLLDNMMDSKMYMAYGALGSGGDLEDVALATEIVKVLKSHGFEMEWNGTADSRIQIVNLAWQKRLID